MSVAVRENLYHKELFRYEERLHLDRGERSLELSIDDALLADTYRERVLSGPAGTVWVKESFTLEAALVPEEQADVTDVMPLAVSRPLPVDFRVDWPGTLVRQFPPVRESYLQSDRLVTFAAADLVIRETMAGW